MQGKFRFSLRKKKMKKISKTFVSTLYKRVLTVYNNIVIKKRVSPRRKKTVFCGN